MTKKRAFSGIQPTGHLHLGNYLGAISNWVKHQDERENIFCIVDLHAITVPQEPKDLKRAIIDTAKIYLAAGLDPAKTDIFVQSSRPEHSELAWILNNFTYFGEMGRMTQFKDKSKRNIFVTMGLFDYPVLMAADILLYDSDEVPVGEDQKQHVEITRDIAERINHRFQKDVFVVPTPVIGRESSRIMSLTSPGEKMSKSEQNDFSRINILDEPDMIRKKFAKATTDSGSDIKYDPIKKPGISNLLSILSSVTGKSVKEQEKAHEGKSYADFKNIVAEAVIKELSPLQDRFNKLSDKEVVGVLKNSSDKIAPRAQATLKRAKDTIGLGI